MECPFKMEMAFNLLKYLLFFHLMIPQGEKRNEIKVGLYS
jgi:hypothetical protein